METDDALWQRHIQINQYGCFLGMKAVVPRLTSARMRRSSRIARPVRGHYRLHAPEAAVLVNLDVRCQSASSVSISAAGW